MKSINQYTTDRVAISSTCVTKIFRSTICTLILSVCPKVAIKSLKMWSSNTKLRWRIRWWWYEKMATTMPHRAYSITNAISKMLAPASIWMLVAATIYTQTRLSMPSAISSSYENWTVPFLGHAPAKLWLPIRVSPSSASISLRPRTSASGVDSLSRLLPVLHQRDLTILKTVRIRKRPLKVTMSSDIWRTSLTSICPSNSSMQDISNRRPVKVVGLNRSSWIWAYHRVFLTQTGHVSRGPGMGATMPPCRPTIIAAPRCLLCRAIRWKQKTR